VEQPKRFLEENCDYTRSNSDVDDDRIDIFKIVNEQGQLQSLQVSL